MKKKQVEKEQNNEKQLPRQETTLGEDIFQLLLKIVLIILAVILGDLVMYYRLDKRFVSGDIAVFKKDGRTTTGRVVAVAGDTVDITKDGLMINGATQISQDIYFDTTQFQNGVDFPITVGEGQIFVLGDNRPEASDSRIYGCINIKDVKGKAIAVIRTRGL